MMTNQEPDAAAPLKQDERHDNGLRHEQEERACEEATSTTSGKAEPARRTEADLKSHTEQRDPSGHAARCNERATTDQQDSGQQP